MKEACAENITVESDAPQIEGERKLVLDVILFLFYLTNLFLHSLGSYLLIRLYRRGKDDVEQIYLIQLSITDAMINLLSIVQTPLVEQLPVSEKVQSALEDLQYHVAVVLGTGLTLINYVTVMYITVDKLLEIFLNIRYPLYWSQERAKYLIITTWSVGLLICIIFSIISGDHCNKVTYQDIFPVYVYPTFDFIFIIIAVTTYVFIFRKFMEKRGNDVTHSTKQRKHKQNVIKVFFKSRFYVSALLIASFLVFVVLPDLLWLFVDIIYKKRSYDLVAACNMCYSIWYLSNAFIYIYLKVSVKQLFWKRLYHTFPFLNRRRNAIQTTDNLTFRGGGGVQSRSEAGNDIHAITPNEL